MVECKDGTECINGRSIIKLLCHEIKPGLLKEVVFKPDRSSISADSVRENIANFEDDVPDISRIFGVS